MVIFFLVLVIRLFMLCCKRGAGPLTVSAVLRGLKTAAVNPNDEMKAKVREQTLIEDEEDTEHTALAELHESGEAMEDLSKRTKHLERQVRELLGRLSDTEERVSILVTGQISLKATVADATRASGTPSSYDKRF